ncbi:MAG: HAMP domain-containing histidine kinase [Myxococcales bacterium]|nr:HAMP domain-containing histidine kinase [Myxococcales bacterium]
MQQAEQLLRAVAVADAADAPLLAEILDSIGAALRGERGAHERFASVVSHELRSVLMPISLFVEAMLVDATQNGRVPSQEELVQRLGMFKQQLARANHDLVRLLDFSRIRSGRLDLELADVDLSATVADVVAGHRDEIARAGCTVEVESPGPIVGRWDPLRLHQIATNLLSNAVKFGAGALIEVALSGDDERARLVVRDRGPGIEAEQRDAIFARFERAHPTQHQSGYGVGLWVVARIVEAFGGTIAVESEPGQGATFIVTLPRSPS